MLHDFGNNDDTAAVIRKELKIEPEEFDKQFLAHRRSRDAERPSTISTNGRSSMKDVVEMSRKKD